MTKSMTPNKSDSGEEVKTDCVFCNKLASKDGVHYLGDGIYRFTPLNPVVEGHMLFVSTAHTSDASASPMTTGLVFAAAARWAASNPDNQYNLITSKGTNATQSIKHLHVHYVPRVAGDGLTLPWTGQRLAQYLGDKQDD